MEFDPHTLHHILQRIRQQMRCPQCGDKVPVDMASIRITGDDFLIMQLRCDACDAYIVLHASLQGIRNIPTLGAERDALKNASSSIHTGDVEVHQIASAIERAAGSFDALFESKADTKKIDRA